MIFRFYLNLKSVFIPIILASTFCLQAFGQENVDCPTIKVIPPSKVTAPDSAMLFSVSIAGKFDTSKLEYKWITSIETILDGQGTPAISVATTKEMSAQTVTVTVEVTGLSEGCKSSFSETGEVAARIICRCYDEYGKLSWLDEKHRLEQLRVELSNDPTAKGYLIFSIEKDSELELVFSRQKKILKYLRSIKIPSSRILMKIQKNEGYFTRIRIIPEGAELPE